jgi:hypothetical protein
VSFALAPVYVVLRENHPAARKELVVFDDLGKDEWIAFPKRFDPVVHDAIMEVARRKGIVCKRTHEVFTPEQAIHLVSEQLGVAILTKACDVGLRHEGVVVKSFSETSLRLEACLIMRADDDSRLVNEFARSFLRKYALQRPPVPLENLEMSERTGIILISIILSSDADFSHDTPRHSTVDLSLASCSRTRKPGSAPPNRCASAIREKTPDIDLMGPPAVDLSVPPLARLALGARHRQARNGRGLASRRFSTVLDMEGAPRSNGATGHFARVPGPDSQDVPGESSLGRASHPR